MKSLDEVVALAMAGQPNYYIRYRMGFNDYETFGSANFVREIVKRVNAENGEGEAEVYSVIKGHDVTLEFIT